jgi:hypothetical protein
LSLNGLTGALLGDLLSLALLVETTEDDGPVKLRGLETLEEVRLALAVDETERLIQSQSPVPCQVLYN